MDKERGRVVYTVTDTGPGVPPEKAEAIFDRFTKLNDYVQGTGLGLSICRDIAEHMGASVYLDTTYTDGGARFVFEIPIVPPERYTRSTTRIVTKSNTKPSRTSRKTGFWTF